MPFKRMTLREQRRAKRDLRRLRRLEHDLHSQYSGTKIAEGSLCDFAGGAIKASLELGYIVIVRGHQSDSKKLVAAAYRLGETP